MNQDLSSEPYSFVHVWLAAHVPDRLLFFETLTASSSVGMQQKTRVLGYVSLSDLPLLDYDNFLLFNIKRRVRGSCKIFGNMDRCTSTGVI